jgi:hypothetical protein
VACRGRGLTSVRLRRRCVHLVGPSGNRRRRRRGLRRARTCGRPCELRRPAAVEREDRLDPDCRRLGGDAHPPRVDRRLGRRRHRRGRAGRDDRGQRGPGDPGAARAARRPAGGRSSRLCRSADAAPAARVDSCSGGFACADIRARRPAAFAGGRRRGRGGAGSRPSAAASGSGRSGAETRPSDAECLATPRRHGSLSAGSAYPAGAGACVRAAVEPASRSPRENTPSGTRRFGSRALRLRARGLDLGARGTRARDEPRTCGQRRRAAGGCDDARPVGSPPTVGAPGCADAGARGDRVTSASARPGRAPWSRQGRTYHGRR